MIKRFRLKPTSVAVAALTGAALAPQAEAVNLATDGIGEVAIAPYYTTRDGWQSLINVTNTQDRPVVVKIRFHEGRNSRDVFDINVALSGFDVFTGVIKQGESGPVFEVTDLKDDGSLDTCVIPHQKTFNLSPGGQLAFSGTDDRGNSNADGGPVDTDRLSEGYVEFIVLGNTQASSGIGSDIENHICTGTGGTSPGGSVQNAFATTDSDSDGDPNILETAQQFGEPINALKYNYRLLNPDRGVEVAGHAVTWANFYNPAGGPDDQTVADAGCTITRGEERDAASPTPGSGTDWDPNDGLGLSCPNLITAQVPFDFLEPTLNDAYPAVANWWDDSANVATTVTPGTTDAYRVVFSDENDGDALLSSHPRGVDALSLTIQRAAVINEWSSNSNLGVATNWVVTFPTKGFYVDQGDGRQFAVIDGDRDETVYCDIGNDGNCDDGDSGGVGGDGIADSQVQVPYPPFAKAFAQTIVNAPSSAKSCSKVQFDRFDRQENSISITGDVIPSPAPVLPTAELCFETNVLTFNGQSVLGSQYATDVDTTPLLPSQAGWLWLDLTTDDAANAAATVQLIDNNGATLTVDGGLEGYSGLPVIGFLVKQRTFGDVTKNFGSAIDHAYQRVKNELVINTMI